MDLNLKTGKILIILLTINCLSSTAAQPPKEDKSNGGSGWDDDGLCGLNCEVIIEERKVPEHTKDKPNPLHIIFTGVIIALCVLVAAAGAGYWAKKKKNILKKNPEPGNVQQEAISLIPTTTPKTLEEVCLQYSIRIFNSNEVKVMENIGQGHFGEVFKGEIGERKVAVKKARSEFSALVTQEIEAMGGLSRHANILALIGIVHATDSDSPGLIFDFMEFGNLQDILRESNPKLDQTSTKYLLAQETLGVVAWQIANGMKFLSSQRLIHRDLAARNCLMSGKGVVKISDFGLSRDVYLSDYYKIPDWNLESGPNRRVPLRWLSPESLQYGSFTVESDVWAYGMVLLEIYSWGGMPYCGNSNHEACTMILDGTPPMIPAECPSVIEQMMKRCWKVEPKHRITIYQLCDEFQNHPELTQFSKGGSLAELKIDASGYLVPK